MESRKNMNKAGVLNWTPAPIRTSPPSSAMSEDGWEDEGDVDGYCGGGDDEEEEEEEAEELRAEDFERHMDENGIIGLREALEDVELGAKGDDEDEGGGSWCIPNGACGGPEEPFPGGSTTAYSEEEHVPPAAVTKPSGRNGRSEKCRIPKSISPFSPSHRLNPGSSPSPSPSPSPLRSYTYPHLLHFSSEELAQSVGIEAETLPDGDGFTESLPESCCSSSSRRVSHASKPHRLLDVATRDMDPHHGLKVRLDPALAEGGARHKRTKDMSEKSRTERPKRVTPSQRKMREYSPGASTSRPSNLPERPSRTAWSMKYQAAPPERQYAPNASQGGRISTTPRERYRKTLRTFAKNEPEVRREAPSFRTPDFSKVEPKVYFPKSGYEPPKSRSSSSVRLSPEPTLVFKSPADIAKEILFSSTDAAPSPPPSLSGPEQNITISIVPEDFRCPQRATRLVEQLQEDYNTLLTRFAEAENTIDRLRLRAKVNLYSDPKRPDQSFRSRMTREGSKVMTLSFPHAQRAVMGSTSGHQNRQEQTQPAGASPGPPCSGSSSSSRGSCGSTESPSKTLRKQANKFLQQVKRFEDLITSGKLEPFERLKGLSRLVQGLDLLERGYLAARDESRQLHRRVAEVRPFDPNRELEGLIFQCGTCVEELRELSEQEQYSSLAAPSPAPRPSSVSLMSESTEPLSHPQSPVVLLPGETGPTVGAGMGMSSASGESGGEGEGEEHLFLRPFRTDELDFGSLMDSFQSFQELPTPAPVQTRGARCSPRGPRQPHDPGGTRPAGGAQTGLTERQSTSDDDRATPTRLSTSQSDRPSLKAAEQSQDRSLPVQSARPSSQQQQQQQQPPGLQPRGLKAGRYPSSSLTSLGESGEWETKSSRPGGASRRVMSQDGIISPETDSGFVGSDGTPAAVISPLHQGAPESTSAPQTRIPRKQRVGSLSVQVSLPLPPTTTTTSSSPPPPAPQEHSSSEGARLGNSGTSRRPIRNSRQERRRDSTAGASQRLVGPMPQTTAGSGTSDLGLESEPSHCVSEYDGEDDDGGQRTAGSSGSRCGPSLSYRHDEPHNAPGPGGQVMDHNVSEAMQELQVEVSRLKERLESSLRSRRAAHPPLPASPPGPPSQPQPTRTSPAPPQPSTSTPRVSSGRSRVDGGGGARRRQGWTVPEGAQGGGGQPAWRRRASSAPTQRPQQRGEEPERGHSASRCPPSRAVPSALPPDGPAWTLPPEPNPWVESQPQPDPWSGSSVPSDEMHAFHQHSARQLGRSARPGNEAPVAPRVCAMCGLSEPAVHVDPHTVHRRGPQHVPRGPQPAAGLEGGPGGPGLTAAAPSLLGSLGMVHWLPACHPALLLCSCAVTRSDSLPPCIHAHSLGRATSEVRGHGEVSRYPGHPLVVEQQDSLSCSLNKAIRAARDMKLTSRRMAHSLASGLHYQETLSQSCIY